LKQALKGVNILPDRLSTSRRTDCQHSPEYARAAGIAEAATQTEEVGKEILRCAGILQMSFPVIKAISFDSVRNGDYIEGFVRIVFDEPQFLHDYSESMRQFLTILSKMLY